MERLIQNIIRSTSLRAAGVAALCLEHPTCIVLHTFENQNKYGSSVMRPLRSFLPRGILHQINLGVGISLPCEIKSKILMQSIISQGKSMPMQERDKLRQGAGRGR